MAIQEVKFVVGASYGDEGKGVMSNYFTKIAKQRNMAVLNVLYNGGCQRGHTAQGHVFHCFGSGAKLGADTYYTKNFMVNPIAWYFEYQDLDYMPKLFIHPKARVTTPYDVAVNQALERKRGDKRHGSCGLGILETRHRSEWMVNHLVAEDFLDEFTLYSKLIKIKTEYFPARCKELKIEAEINPYEFDNFISCIHQMMTCGNVEIIDEEIFKNYNSIIFEGGQGLLLSETNIPDFPHLTPSITGVDGARNELSWIFNNSNANYEFCVVTRPYLTRHGAGPLPNECKREDISDKIVDETNMPNEWQGSLRFAPLSYYMLYKWLDMPTIQIDKTVFGPSETFQFTTAITCLDQTDGKLAVWLPSKNKIEYFDVTKPDGIGNHANRIYAFYGKDTLPRIYL